MAILSKGSVFITGISGFTGIHLSNYLNALGYKVFGLTSKESEFSGHFKGDLLDKEILKAVLKKTQPDYIVHLGAISFVGASDLKKMYEVNILGTTNLLEVISEENLNPKKILIASSATVYGNAYSSLSEDLCPCPVNHYGNSKLAMEHLVKTFMSNLKIIIARPFNYTGVGQEPHFLIPKIVAHYKAKKKQISLGNIYPFREFNNLEFVLKCYEKMLFLPLVHSDILNVCSGKVYNISQILALMNKIANYKIEVVLDKSLMRATEIEVLKGDTTKLFKTIGDFSAKNSLEKTLLEMYQKI